MLFRSYGSYYCAQGAALDEDEMARKKPGADSVTWVDPKVLKRMAREAAAAEAAAQEGEENV